MADLRRYGFLKILQFVFALCAVTTTSSFGSSFSFTVNCTDTGINATISQDFGYPFQFDLLNATNEACGNVYEHSYYGDFSFDAKFFVICGIISLLYSFGTTIYFCSDSRLYQTHEWIRLIDFLITLAFCVFWLTGSAIWTSGVYSVKYVSNPDNIANSLDICKLNDGCTTEFAGDVLVLYVSLGFGFLTCLLWAVNLCILYKDSPWFQNSFMASAQHRD